MKQESWIGTSFGQSDDKTCLANTKSVSNAYPKASQCIDRSYMSLATSERKDQTDSGSDHEHRNEQILTDVNNLYQTFEIPEEPPRKIVWSRMVPHWGPINPAEPVFLGREVFVHNDLESLTSDEVKPIIASSLVRLKKTGKHERAIGLLIVCLLFAVLVASFILLPLVLPQRVPLSCRTCEPGYGPLGDAITIYLEPIVLILAGIFLLRAYSHHQIHKADRGVAATIGKDQLVASLNAILSSVIEPPKTSRSAASRRTRRSLKLIRDRIKTLESK